MMIMIIWNMLMALMIWMAIAFLVEELHVDGSSSVPPSRLPPPPCSRTILQQDK